MILFPLLLALNAAAGEPAVMKPARTFAQGVVDPTFTIIATPTESSVNLWSLTTGRQVGHADLPSFKREHEKDVLEVSVHTVRMDLKLVLASIKHWRYNTSWRAGAPGNYWKGMEHRVVLASLEDGVPVKTLWSGSGGCGSYGIQDRCPGTIWRDGTTRILDDRPEVVVHGLVSASGEGDSFRKTETLLAFDLKGRKLFENETSYAPMNLVRGTEKSYPPADGKPGDSVSSDDQSCRVLRGGKTTAYLEGCKASDYPSLSPDGRTVVSNYNDAGSYIVWDAESGAKKIDFNPKEPAGWSHEKFWQDGPNGRVVIMASGPGQAAEMQIWDPRSGTLAAVGRGPDFKGAYSIRAGNGLVLFDRNDKDEKGNDAFKTVVLELGDAPAQPAGPAPAPAVAKTDVDTLPSAAMKTDPEAFAVVIGVEKYRSAGVPVVDYAARDAKTVAAYLGVMGFDAKNVAVLTDAEAGKVDFDKYFGKWLQNRVGPKSRVFVYYAGHGAPNPTTGEGYLMPYEADPSYLDESAYPVARLYAELSKLPTRDVTVVLDACFSGQGERSLIAKGTRPLVAVQKTAAPTGIAVLAAASGSQISASDHEAHHGLLTYHLLAGLHGAADANGDGKITASEAFAYARPAVERAAKLQNVEQTPTVSGVDSPSGARVWLSVKKP